MVWWPEYDKKLGEPKGPYTRSGLVFKRSFEHLNVELDCAKVEADTATAAKFEWINQ